MKSQPTFSLIYRGTSYQQTPVAVKTEPTSTFMRYRGADYSLQQAVHLPISTRQNLKYRGIPYCPETAMNLIPCPTY